MNEMGVVDVGQTMCVYCAECACPKQANLALLRIFQRTYDGAAIEKSVLAGFVDTDQPITKLMAYHLCVVFGCGVYGHLMLLVIWHHHKKIP